MKKLALALALLGLLATGGQAVASTLHVPHFEVDLGAGDGVAALLAVSNASSTAVIARVDIFNRFGDWLGPFHVELQPDQTMTLNWRDVLTQGREICFPHVAFLSSAALQAGLDDGQDHQRYVGYAQVNAVTSCSLTPPDDPAFTSLLVDGAELHGDLLRVDPANNFADGDRLPGRLCPGRHLVRFMAHGGVFDGTRLFLYAPGLSGPDPVPVGLTAADEGGNPVSLSVNFIGGLRALATNAYDVDGNIGPNGQFGTLTVDCGEHPCYVSAEYRAEGRFSAGVEAAPLDPCP